MSVLPIAVDLDGTLTRANTILAQAVALWLSRPWSMLAILPLLLRGTPVFKRRLAALSPINVLRLPFHPELVSYLESEAAKGREIILVTAADQSSATYVASLFPFFREGIGSDGRLNLAGRAKAAYLVQRYGEKQFVYAGNERRDIRVWERAGAAIVVNAPARVRGYAKKHFIVEREF